MNSRDILEEAEHRGQGVDTARLPKGVPAGNQVERGHGEGHGRQGRAQSAFFSFGPSEHDGVFSFPAVLGGAEAYLFRWRLVTSTFLDDQVILTRASHSKGFVLDQSEPAW